MRVRVVAMADSLGTDRKILEMLKKKPQVTFACNKEDAKCTFECKVLPAGLQAAH